MTSYAQLNLIKYDGKRYLSQFVSEMFDSYTKCNISNRFDTVATYWIQTTLILKKFLATLHGVAV